jgi:hypothetical protein
MMPRRARYEAGPPGAAEHRQTGDLGALLGRRVVDEADAAECAPEAVERLECIPVAGKDQQWPGG